MVAVGKGFGSPVSIGFVAGCTTLLANAMGQCALRLDVLPNALNSEFQDIDLYHACQRFLSDNLKYFIAMTLIL